ncbi:TetR/AcrR family transcriptional regulator [Halopseudomonas pachastrellae]|uniref:TetR/AcrR family transcriptional regulator n=1 Tax=Halopseudomonas pachastrellae TaxID=254161 RepID=UPI003D7CED73
MSNMNDTQRQIAAALECAFAQNGFAEIGVDGLRAASGVSLRTLYKYFPSREEMVLAALQHRHARYLSWLFDSLPEHEAPAWLLDEVLERTGRWMAENTACGCLFLAAVAAHPGSEALHAMLTRHKCELAQHLAAVTGWSTKANELLLLHESVTQTWPVLGEGAVVSAKRLAALLAAAETET